jgi:hypothetical protein
MHTETRPPILTGADSSLIRQLGLDVWGYVWRYLDEEFGAVISGDVATAASQAAEAKLRQILEG